MWSAVEQDSVSVLFQPVWVRRACESAAVTAVTAVTWNFFPSPAAGSRTYLPSMGVRLREKHDPLG